MPDATRALQMPAQQTRGRQTLAPPTQALPMQATAADPVAKEALALPMAAKAEGNFPRSQRPRVSRR